MNTASLADTGIHTVNDDEVTQPGTAAPYATNSNPTALEVVPTNLLQREDMDIFVSGFILVNAASTDEPLFELEDVPENVNDQVWACLDLGLASSNAAVKILTDAALRALKPIR